ncbi:MAG: alpha/beta hydrolase [bacterium]|nr:alpha/beta hydrolase [bacterium]
MTTASNARFFETADGLKLFYRDFGPEGEGTPVLCLPGLTRNSRDFDEIAERLSSRRRVLTIDFRGRGHSDPDPDWRNYHPGTYVADVQALLDALGVETVIVLGTSLGGVCGMVMAAQRPHRVAGLILNDVGPEIHPAGLERVRSYTGRAAPVTSWEEAREQTRETYGDALPGLGDDDFMKLARRTYREDAKGIPRLDIDVEIGRAVRELPPADGDPWRLFAAIGDKPITVLWGVLSDILSRDIVERMRAEKPDLEVLEVPNRGHVPLLDEPECLAAIEAFLDRVR